MGEGGHSLAGARAIVAACLGYAWVAWHSDSGCPPGLRRVKALVLFWLIDETLSANLVYQSDHEIGSTIPSDEATVKIMMMVMPW